MPSRLFFDGLTEYLHARMLLVPRSAASRRSADCGHSPFVGLGACFGDEGACCCDHVETDVVEIAAESIA